MIMMIYMLKRMVYSVSVYVSMTIMMMTGMSLHLTGQGWIGRGGRYCSGVEGILGER